MAIERRLTEIVGPVGGKLHTARSRNDQVATDVAMFTRAHALQTLRKLPAPAERDRPARRAPRGLGDARLHAPAARPARLPLAPPARLLLDVPPRREPLRVRARRDRGAAARRRRARRRELRDRPPARGARARLRRGRAELDRRRLQPRLRARLPRPPRRRAPRTSRGSARRSCCGPRRSSASARSSDAWASGSSIMPQKKNPDAAELLRAKAPRVAARLGALHGVMHGLPLTYNKDMQEDKEHLFDAVDTLDLCLQAAAGMLETIAFDRERLAAAAADELIAATDIADLLVKRGVPFRQSHGIVAGIVRETLASGPHALRPQPRRARAPLRGARRRVLRGALPAVLARVQGLRGRHVARARARAALPRARGARGPARRVVEALPAAFYDRPGPGRRPRPRRLRAAARPDARA